MTSLTDGPTDCRGFTLIEVLVAVGLFFGGIAVLLAILAQMTSALDIGASALRADGLWRAKMTAIEQGARERHAPDTGTARFDGENADFSWNVRLTPVMVAGEERLEEVTVTVSRGASDRKYSGTTWMKNPAYPRGI